MFREGHLFSACIPFVTSLYPWGIHISFFFQDCGLLFMVVVFNLSLLITFFFFYAAASSVNSLTFLCASFCVEMVGANLSWPFGAAY